MTRALRGVNLGGWLVAERWMTPELFKGVDGQGEAELIRQLGYAEAVRRLEAHRGTFIQEADIAWLAQQGIELLRVPVGYWLFDGADDFIPTEVYLDCLFEWAVRHELRVIIDLHGLPGSQNGKDHSGAEGRVLFYRRANQRAALAVLRSIVQKYGGHPCLAGIQIINEPRWSLGGFRLAAYYRQAYRIVANGTPAKVKVIVSDGFRPNWMSYILKWMRLGPRLVMDVHLYQAYSARDRRKTEEQYMQTVNRVWAHLLLRVSKRLPVMVGEWSTANQLPTKHLAFESRYYTAQKELFNEHVWAQCYWSYKAPGRGAWDLASRSYFRKM